MPKNQQRLSQIVTTFGPGAMLDLPTRSVLVRGLEHWDMREKAFKPISEARLATKLQKELIKSGRLPEGTTLSLRSPPLDNDIPGREPPGVEVTVFPTWFVCDPEAASPTDSDRRRRLVPWKQLAITGGRRQYELDSGRKVDATPIRFVAACKNGHLQDIDWHFVVHGKAPCSETMWLEEKGTSADPRDTRIVCDCGKSLSLAQLFQRGRLGMCNAERPWIGDRDPNGCKEKLRLLTRSATNTYFPQVATVISLPRGDDDLSRIVQAHLTDLGDVRSVEDVGLARRFNPAARASLEGYADTDVFARLERLRTQNDQDASSATRVAEFEVFAGGQAVIGENRSDALLFAETLHRDRWDPDGSPLAKGIASLVAVHRLREVSCLYGFTRFEPAPTSVDGELEDVHLAVHGAPLSKDAQWLPAVEQFGEGLFIHVDGAAISEWLAHPAVQDRFHHLLAGHQRWTEGRPEAAKRPYNLPYVMLHSLSHALMTEIALDCGYPASALKERIYALENPAQKSRIDRCGILIYTATAGNQGTLGGLVATASRFIGILASALDRLSVCSNDPICADHEPASFVGDRALHGSACHGCLLIAETSCENRNLLLDRGLLVETMSGHGSGFFVDVINPARGWELPAANQGTERQPPVLAAAAGAEDGTKRAADTLLP